MHLFAIGVELPHHAAIYIPQAPDARVNEESVGWRVFRHEVHIDSIRPCRRLAARGLVGEPGVCRPAAVARRAASRVTMRGEGAGSHRRVMREAEKAARQYPAPPGLKISWFRKSPVRPGCRRFALASDRGESKCCSHRRNKQVVAVNHLEDGWLAAGGETALVTDRDRVVAEIGPPRPTRSSVLADALLSDAFRQRWMTPLISVGRGPPPRQPVMTIDELLRNLQRDRGDR